MAAKASKARSGRGSGGRVTPKGGMQRAPSSRAKGTASTEASSRYTPPIPAGVKESPRWVPAMAFTLLGLGMLIIILDYSGLLPGSPNNWMLIPALVCITGSLVAFMNYR